MNPLRQWVQQNLDADVRRCLESQEQKGDDPMQIPKGKDPEIDLIEKTIKLVESYRPFLSPKAFARAKAMIVEKMGEEPEPTPDPKPEA